MVAIRLITKAAVDTRAEEILACIVDMEQVNAMHRTQVNVLWEGTTIPCFITDETGVKVVKVNQAYLDLWGFRHRSQAFTDEWLEQLNPEMKDIAIQRMSAIAANHTEWVYDNELTDGRTIRFIGHPLWQKPYSQEGFLGYAGCVLDLGVRDEASLPESMQYAF